jgi:hypothetical protein
MQPNIHKAKSKLSQLVATALIEKDAVIAKSAKSAKSAKPAVRPEHYLPVINENA